MVSPNACCAAVEALGTIVLVSVAAGVTGGMLALRFNRSTSPLTLSYVWTVKAHPCQERGND